MTVPAPAAVPPRERVRAARTAVLVVFALAGIVFASWAARIADTKEALGLTPGQLGTVLLAASAGSVTGLPLAGSVTGRLGAGRAVAAGAVVALAGLVAFAVAVDLRAHPLAVAAGLYLLGLGVGLWDVAMNLEGAAVERELGFSVMPHFHAAFSGGTVLAATVGAGMSWAAVPLVAHLLGAVLVTVVLLAWALRRFLPAPSAPAATPGGRATSGGRATPGPIRHRSAWLEPRTLLIGVVVLAAGATEGTANDWLAVAFDDGHDLPAWAGVLGFATFLAFMTLGRLAGTGLLDRHGRVPVLRAGFGLAVLGALLVVFGAGWVAFAGAAVWGLGAALGFPVGMSAAADDPQRAAALMSVVATIGYLAFIAGPPVLGFLGDRVGVLRALLVVGALALLALSVVTSVREPGGGSGGGGRRGPRGGSRGGGPGGVVLTANTDRTGSTPGPGAR